MRYLGMLCCVGIGVVMALGVEAGSSPEENTKIVAAAVAALANAPKNVCPEGFAYIPAGPFVMGSANIKKGDAPVHTVSTDAYCMAIHETTNAEYQKIIKEPLAIPKGFDGLQQPVVKVNWTDANEYCKKIRGRLPTEAEWEKGARGPRGLEFATHSGTLNTKEANYVGDKTTDVCSYPKNDYGLCDMTGNVWEWVSDWYAADAYKRMKPKNPQWIKSGGYKVLRGGTWGAIYGPDLLRAAFRNGDSPDDRIIDIGFRCVVPVLNPSTPIQK